MPIKLCEQMHAFDEDARLGSSNFPWRRDEETAEGKIWIRRTERDVDRVLPDESTACCLNWRSMRYHVDSSCVDSRKHVGHAD